MIIESIRYVVFLVVALVSGGLAGFLFYEMLRSLLGFIVQWMKKKKN